MNKNLVDFFLEVGKVKRQKQRGLVLRGIKDPARIGGHSFREALMGWSIAKTTNAGLDSSRVIKLVLLHDLCRGHAGDITPYDFILKNQKNKKKSQEVYKKWIRLPRKEKEQFFKETEKKEHKALKSLIRNLPNSIANELRTLWDEYHSRVTKEARFVYQLHIMENFIQALEYWSEDKNFPIESWWQQMKETISDSLLLELLKELDKKFYKG